jgi:hypothetical protein
MVLWGFDGTQIKTTPKVTPKIQSYHLGLIDPENRL